jgi:hypothetical protein
MNLRYNAMLGRFETTSLNSVETEILKGAGFKTDGPPSWVWHTGKVPVIQKLRANKPASGLTIDDDARAVYVSMEENFNKNAAIKAEARKISQAQKKEAKLAEQTLPDPPDDCPMDGTLPPCIFAGKELKRSEELSEPYKAPPHPGPWCVLCKVPVYFYEMLAPWALCLWCERTLSPQNKA